MNMVDDIEVLKRMITQFEELMKECVMNINIRKTKAMRINDREIMKVKKGQN